MKSLKTPWTVILPAVLAFSFLLQSCDKNDPVVVTEDGIPAGFNFLTVKSVDLQVNVNDQHDGQYLYKVEVYDQNPLTSDTVVNLLAGGVASKSNTFTTRVVIPQYVKTLYVKQTDPSKRVLVKAVSVENVVSGSKVSSNFKPQSASSSSVMQKAPPVHTDLASDYPLPATYETVTSAITLMGAVYYVPVGTTITNLNFGWLASSELYVAGELVFTGNANIYVPGGTKLVLLPGATVTFVDINEMSFSQAGIIVAVHEGASLIFEKKAGFGAGSKLINDGEVRVAESMIVRQTSVVVNNNNLTANEIELTNSGVLVNYDLLHLLDHIRMNSSATLVNNGTVQADKSFISNNQTVKTYNNNLIKTPFFDFARGGGELFNACRIECEDLLIEGSIIHNGDGALIICQDFETNNTTYNLTGGSMIIAKDLGFNNIDEVKDSGATLKNNIVINGAMVGSTQPLFSLWKIANTNGSKVVTLNGVFEFSVTDGLPANKYFNAIGVDVTMSTNPVTVIPGSACNQGGINSGGGNGNGDGDGGNPPADPSFPIEVIEGTDYVYSMEDLWPHMGDYDMNDFVFKIHAITKFVNNTNKVEKMTFKLTPLAAGSTLKLSAALQLDGVPEGAISVSSTGDMARIDPGHTLSNLILFENVHGLFGLTGHNIVNTFNNVEKIQTSTYTFEITFANPVDQSDVSVDKLNFYSIVGEIDSTDRHEIHLSGYSPSSKVQKPTRNYKDDNNMVWALMLPTATYKYPAENVKIFDAYPEFMNWAKSGGKENVDWYLNPSDSEGLIYNK